MQERELLGFWKCWTSKGDHLLILIPSSDVSWKPPRVECFVNRMMQRKTLMHKWEMSSRRCRYTNRRKFVCKYKSFPLENFCTKDVILLGKFVHNSLIIWPYISAKKNKPQRRSLYVCVCVCVCTICNLIIIFLNKNYFFQ